MRFMVGVCILLMVVISYTKSLYQTRDALRDTGTIKDIPHKRSLSLTLAGVKAFKQLVANAKYAPSQQSKYYTGYLKYGDVEMAYKDFYATNPQMVSEGGYHGVKVLHGIVGDREIVLRDPTKSAKRAGGLVYIDLIDTNAKRAMQPGESRSSRYIDRIMYVNKNTNKSKAD